MQGFNGKLIIITSTTLLLTLKDAVSYLFAELHRT